MSEEILSKLLDYCSKLIKRWVFSLEEFYPESSGLHGMNINKKIIKIRLRSPDNRDVFMSWDFILGTFIHELAHMEIPGPKKLGGNSLGGDLKSKMLNAALKRQETNK